MLTHGRVPAKACAIGLGDSGLDSVVAIVDWFSEEYLVLVLQAFDCPISN